MFTSHTLALVIGLLAVLGALTVVSPPIAGGAGAGGGTGEAAEDKAAPPAAADDGPQLAHMVYFKLKDNSPVLRAKLVAACKLLLTNHVGTVSFATGTLAGDYQRDVNDRDWDVSLHLVFLNKAAHDKYQDHPRHQRFIAENQDNWEKVRVFDSYLSPVPVPKHD